MGPVLVVAVEPGPHGGAALRGAGEGLQVGPFAQAGLDEPFRLAVGSGRVGPGALVLEPGIVDRLAEGMADIGRPVVGHDPLDGDAQAGEPGDGALEEGDRAFLALVGQDLGEGEARGVVDADVEEVPADAAFPAAPVTDDAVADAVDPAQLLDVDVDELAGPLALVADRLGPGVEGAEPPE